MNKLLCRSMRKYILAASSLFVLGITGACVATPDEDTTAPVVVIAPLADSDPAMLRRGKIVYLQCRACHSTEEGGEHKVGPNLHGLFGAEGAQKAGFNYSEALQKKGITWNAKSIDAFIAKPSAYVPGTIMAFAGVSAAEDRAALIAFLNAETQ